MMMAQEYRIIKGQVTDSLPVAPGSQETFAVFAPKDYNLEKQWPAIFLFDPEGRGKTTSQLFRSSAEDLGYLVISPNFSLKGKKIDSIIQSSADLIRNVYRTFPIDSSEIYVGGMAEGAQLASTVPMFLRGVSGVLAVGNAFVNPRNVNRNNPYAFVGMAGNKDYMVYKMEEYQKFYDNIGFPTAAVFFDGEENEWPDANAANVGFTNLALLGKRLKGTLDPETLKKIYNAEFNYVQSQISNNRALEAFEHLKRMEKKYDDTPFEDQIKEKRKEVKKSRLYRDQRAAFSEVTMKERVMQDEYSYLMDTDINAANFENIGWWAYQMDELQKTKANPSAPRANMAYRLHGYLDMISKQRFNDVMNAEVNLPNRFKIYVAVLRTAISKKDPEAYLKIMSIASQDGDYDTALLYLEDLLKTGFSDREAINNVPGTLGLRLSEEYKALMSEYLDANKQNDPKS